MILTDVRINIISIFFSTLISIFVAVFLMDHLKTSARDICNSVAEAIKESARLPKSIENYRILRFSYLSAIPFGVSFLHVAIRPATDLPEVLTYFVIVSSSIPIILLCFYVICSLFFEIVAYVADLAKYFCWVPYKLYKDRNSPSLSQLMMLWGWALFFAIWGIIVVYLFRLVFTM